MENNTEVKSVFVELQLLEKRLAELETDYAAAEAERRGRPGAAAENPEGARIAEIRRLVARLKEDATCDSCDAVLKEKQLADLKKDAAQAQARLAALSQELKAPRRAPHPAGEVAEDLRLTAGEDHAHNLLEEERRDFKTHYDALEKEFEDREKQLLEENRAQKEAALKSEMETERLRTDLLLAQERRAAAESKASSLALEIMELNVYAKSAAAALKDKDLEIADLKRALEEAGRPKT